MVKKIPAHRFRWTVQARRAAVLLSAFGHSDRKIGLALGCEHSTVWRRLGPVPMRPELSAAELAALFERYDAQRNIEEVIAAPSGTVVQARLRTSHRARKPGALNASAKPADPNFETEQEALSDEQLRREVEALVGQSIGLCGAD